MTKPGTPQGMRDFDAATVLKRQFILDTIKTEFKIYGFEPLETPAMENLDILIGKYGDEGDKLIFKVLNNGLDNEKNRDKLEKGVEEIAAGKASKFLTERALKYDLTIPFARYVAQNYNILTMPYRRYQVQPVWRADRPQKGRYREFTQCDADIVGSDSLYNEVELALLYDSVFTKLGLSGYSLAINNRKILAALAADCGGAEKMTAITVAIDKLDKIGIDKVKEELTANNISNESVEKIVSYLQIEGSNKEKLKQIKVVLSPSDLLAHGIEELEFITDKCEKLTIDFTLARGLNYYTGTILEAKAPSGVQIGSIGGGGRYDDLTGMFGVKGVPGVGISFGVDRIYDVMEALDIFPQSIAKGTSVLFMNMGEQEVDIAFTLMQKLRGAGISCELFPKAGKLDKQIKYADKKNIQFAIVLGSKEIEKDIALVKTLATGHQESVPLSDLEVYLIQNMA